MSVKETFDDDVVIDGRKQLSNVLAGLIADGVPLAEPNPFHAARPELSIVDEDYQYEVEEKQGATVLHFPAREANNG